LSSAEAEPVYLSGSRSEQTFSKHSLDFNARLPRAERFLLPLKAFADHAAVGVVNLTTDKSGTPRGFPMLFRTSDRLELSFPLRVAALATGSEPAILADGLRLAKQHIHLADGFPDQADPEHRLPGLVEKLHLPFGILLEAARDAAKQVAADPGHLGPGGFAAFEFRSLVGRACETAVANPEKIQRHG
jgi:hypothetical protein